MKCEDCGKKVEDDTKMEEVYKWLRDIQNKYPPLDRSTYVPLSVRYRHLPIKTLWRTDFEDLLKMPTADELIKEGKLIEEDGKFITVGI